MFSKLLRSVFLSMFVVTSASADDVNGQFAVDGVGSRTCEEFTLALAENNSLAIAFAGWTDGFISAANALRSDTFDLTPWQTVEVVFAKMQSYCAAHPEEAYVQALGKLVSVLDAQRLVAQSEIVQIARQGKAVFIYRHVLENLRSKLIEIGYTPSPLEGVYDESFVKAILAYQVEEGLPETGLPDQPTMVSLFD